MKITSNSTANGVGKNEESSFPKDAKKRAKSFKGAISRRSFLNTSLALGAGTIGAGLLPSIRGATDRHGLT
ncbi:MAG TPA: twin-arginine translocation signal domain-containing protein, partial [Terriglobales bacterium]|nr:twin-arginine translocation signal domain-containing protein [Terriglobales bacterium]